MRQIKISLRNFVKRPVYSLITFVGFVLGIMACLLIYTWVHNELSYDKFHSDHHRIYRVLTLKQQGNEIVKLPHSYRPLAHSLKRDYPQIEEAAFISYNTETSPLQWIKGSEKIEANRCWASEGFFKIFTGFTFLEGDMESAFSDPSQIVLSEKTAQKIFGNEKALGKTVVSDKYGKHIYTIGGVVRIPSNSHLEFGYMLSSKNSEIAYLNGDWRDRPWNRTYIKLAPNASIDETFLSRVSNHLGRYSSLTDKLLFQPLSDIHLRSDYEDNRFDRNMSSVKYVWLFGCLGFLILFMAVFNFSIISVARASERTTEIGVKKVNGAGKLHFIRQFIGESILLTIGASIVGFVLLILLLPAFNRFTGNEVQIIYSPALFLGILVLIIGSGFLAGLYPSFFLASFKPVRIFRKGNITGSPNRVMQSLVITQLVVLIAFLVASSFFIKQLQFIMNRDSGLDKDNIVVVPTGLWYGNSGFKNELLQNPDVLGVSASCYAPIDFQWKSNFSLSGLGRTDSMTASLFWVDEDFAKTYGLEITKGHFLDMDFGAFWKEANKSRSKSKGKEEPTVSFPIVINEKAEKVLGFDDPIGKRLGNNVIVGVVKDFNFRTAYHPSGPIVLTNDPQNIMTMNIKISPYKKAETLQFIRKVYKKHRGEREFNYSFFDDLLMEKYNKEVFMRNIVILFTVLALVISVLGILGISLLAIERRVKEIGVRKVNGARVFEIVKLLNVDYVKWVIVAFILAVPVSFYLVNQWLNNFAYKTPISKWVFVLSGVLVLLVTLMSVTLQSWQAAKRNPVEALRYE